MLDNSKSLVNNIELMNEWNYEKNENSPKDYHVGSNKKVWWKCNNGHEWEAVIASRSRMRRKCPYCTNQRVLYGFNDFETWCINNKKDDLLNQWDYENNREKSPREIIAKSNKNYFWKCNNNHSYEMSPGERIRGRNCPYCANKRLMEGYNDLASRFPHVLNQWDYEKNNFKPNEILFGTRTKAWWKCKYGHSFERDVCNAIKGNECPICNNHQLLTGFNDLETTCPEMAEEWDYDKNDLLPTEIMKNTNTKIWWKCKNGHSWYVSPNSRTSKDGKISICPSCSGRRVWEGVTDICSVKPELLDEWDYEKNSILPQSITLGSNIKVWWKCQNGHSWCLAPNNRVLSNGELSKCPICNNNKLLEGYNDLFTKNPELVKEWNYNKNIVDPQAIKYSSNEKVWWTCSKCGHEWKTSVYNRNISKTGCPQCAKEIQTSFPEQAIYYYVKKLFPDAINGDKHIGMELDIFIPSKSIAIEYDGVKWHSSEKTVKKDLLKNRKCEQKGIELIRIREEGCPELIGAKLFIFEYKRNYYDNLSKTISSVLLYLTGKDLLIDVRNDENEIYSSYARNKGEKSLASLRPDLLMEWDYEKNRPLDPEVVSAGSGKKVWWKCKNNLNHSWKAIIYSRSRENGNGCPICAGLIISPGFNDLKTLFPDIVQEEWDYKKNKNINPSELPSKSHQKVWWKCKRGHSHLMAISHKTDRGGCPICSGKIIQEGENDFKTWCIENNRKDLLLEWDYEKNIRSPEEMTRSPKDFIWWKCDKGHSYKAFIYSRIRGDGCPLCANKQIIKGFNDLESVNPLLAKEWHPNKNGELKPNEIGAGSGKRVWWLKKHFDDFTGKTFEFEWEARVVDRFNGRECPYLSKPAKQIYRGFNDLETRRPDIAKQWHPTKNEDKKPYDVLPNGTYRAWWLCEVCGNEWATAVYNRTNGKNCPICSHKKVAQSKKRRIINIDTDRKYESIDEAANDIGISRASIINACRDKSKTAGGFHWKYL